MPAVSTVCTVVWREDNTDSVHSMVEVLRLEVEVFVQDISITFLPPTVLIDTSLPPPTIPTVTIVTLLVDMSLAQALVFPI